MIDDEKEASGEASSNASEPIENSADESGTSDGACSCCSGDINQPTDPSLLQKTEKVYGSGNHQSHLHFIT